MLGYGHPVYTTFGQVTHSVDAPSIHAEHQPSIETAKSSCDHTYKSGSLV